MKRILVVDESEAVRETLALILGRDFAVAKRSAFPSDDFSYNDEETDLLILGASPGWRNEPSIFLRVASRVPHPILFLVDSRFRPDLREGRDRLDCLAKPFNPYELRERVERLLVQTKTPVREPVVPAPEKGKISRYLDFPYLPASASLLARRFALTSLPILIQAESGCGEERVARALYSLNDKAGPWISAYPPRISKEYLVEQIDQLSRREKSIPQRMTIVLNGPETLPPSAQSSLLSFLEEEEGKGRQFWILSISRTDLLEKVYQGEFLNGLYYRLAMLTLRLPPLRERRADLPALAAWLAQECGDRLSLGKVSLSPAAINRLCNYLWFGNINELEAVIARTLAFHRKSLIESSDLILGIGEEGQVRPSPIAEERPVVVEQKQEVKEVYREPVTEAKKLPRIFGAGNGGDGDASELRILVNELAHELKNPMVTIKTYAQLLKDRFDDPEFRGRFQETVGSDLERMDELLEALLDFSRFTLPVVKKIRLYEQLRKVLEEVLPECVKREVTIRWDRRKESEEVLADESQFRYAVRNVLLTALGQVKRQGEIQIDIEGEGKIAVAYVREGGRMGPFNRYLELSPSVIVEEILPLRIHLAKMVLEKNGGTVGVKHLEEGKMLIRAELPVP